MDPKNFLPKKQFDANHGSGDILGIDNWGRPIIDLSKQKPRDPEDWIAHEQVKRSDDYYKAMDYLTEKQQLPAERFTRENHK